MSSTARRPLVSRLRAGQWFAIAGAALLAVVAICLTLGAASIVHLSHARDELIDRLEPAQTAALRLTNALVNQESGVRGFTLTGREEFLAPYRTGRREEQAALAELRGLRATLRSDTIARDLGRTEQQAQRWRAAYAEPAIAAVAAAGRAAPTPAATESGRRLFEAVRTASRELRADIAGERAAGRERLADAARLLTITFVAIGVLLLLGLAATGLLLRSIVSRPLRRLSRHARRAAGGDFGDEVHGSGARDVVDVGRDVDAMRRRIVRELEAVREANERLDAQALELRRSNTELEQFAYVASHDLQEPLRKVAGFTRLLQRRYQGRLDARADQYIAFAVDGAKRMQQLINDLLGFSRVGRPDGEPRVVPAAELVQAALANLAEAIDEAGATVEVGELPAVRGEPALLTAVFQNLIANAVKFRGSDPPHVRVSAARRDGAWEFAVADNGIGIDPEYAERIFVIFQRLHARDAYAGTGIGLALCRKIVEYHGGQIRLDTQRGAGTTFRFTLPTVEEPDDPA